jgi:hypothetical protein
LKKLIKKATIIIFSIIALISALYVLRLFVKGNSTYNFLKSRHAINVYSGYKRVPFPEDSEIAFPEFPTSDVYNFFKVPEDFSGFPENVSITSQIPQINEELIKSFLTGTKNGRLGSNQYYLGNPEGSFFWRFVDAVSIGIEAKERFSSLKVQIVLNILIMTIIIISTPSQSPARECLTITNGRWNLRCTP